MPVLDWLRRHPKADDDHTGDIQSAQQQQVGPRCDSPLDFILRVLDNKTLFWRFILLVGLLLIFFTAVTLVFGGGVAAVFLFVGIKPVLAVMAGLASATAIPLVGLSVMAVIKKAVGGDKSKPELPAAA